jgi:uncharacterized protein (TIGR03086 family)
MDMSETPQTGWEVLDEARTSLRQVVAGVPEGGWSRPTPCADWSAAQVLHHAALDQQIWGAIVGGTTPSDENAFAPTGVFGVEPADYAGHALDSSALPWTVIDEDAGPVPTPLPHGPMEPATAAAAAALDAAIHAWDIAVATGQESPLTPELARSLIPVAQRIADQLRVHGAFAAALEPDHGADEAAMLLAFLGRHPGWVPRQ